MDAASQRCAVRGNAGRPADIATSVWRLPFVVPRQADHLPHFDRDATSIIYELFHGQWLLDRDGREARYPFGFGLSYGSQAVVKDVAVDAGGTALSVSARLLNEGERDTTEVVQVYAGSRSSRLERPS